MYDQRVKTWAAVGTADPAWQVDSTTLFTSTALCSCKCLAAVTI